MPATWHVPLSLTPCPGQTEIVTHRQLSEAERGQSSTYRELLAIYHGLEQTKRLLEGQALRWFTDSQNVVSIIRKGSMKPDLLNLSILIFRITKEFNISLAMSWVSRDLNQVADFHSRVIDYDDWGLEP